MFVFSAALVRGEGNFQPTRNGKTIVWNDQIKPGDEATWSGARDADGYAHGFGTLVWYTKETDSEKPELYARYWGNMTHGKFNGPVNVHSKKKTHHAIFADGKRITHWSPGPARSRMTSKQIALLEKHNALAVAEKEPEPPAAGPAEQGSGFFETIPDLWSERWWRVEVDESLRVLAWPPRSLRSDK